MSLADISTDMKPVEIVNLKMMKNIGEYSSDTICIMCQEIGGDKFYRNYFIEKGYNLFIRNYKDTSNLLFLKEESISISSNIKDKIIEFVEFQDECLCTIFQMDVYFNSKNRLCKYYIENKENEDKKEHCIEIEQLILEISQSIFETFVDFIQIRREINITILNKRLEKINAAEGIDLKIEKSDFPIWMKEKLI